MPNTPQNFLDQAKTLQASAGCEMEWRTATNRGYYCVYHNALNVKNQLSLPDAINRMGGSHARLYSALEECNARLSTKYIQVKSLGIMASRTLKPYRVNADYDIDMAFPASIMEEVIEKAALLLEKASEIVAEHKLGSPTPAPSTRKPSLTIIK